MWAAWTSARSRSVQIAQRPSSMRPASATSFPGAPQVLGAGLLRERHVAVAPGTTFGGQGEGWVRISLATDTGDLLEGLDRLAGVEARS